MTGFTGGNDREDYFAKPTNHPSMGSVCQYLGVGRRAGPARLRRACPPIPATPRACGGPAPTAATSAAGTTRSSAPAIPTFPRPLGPGKDDYDPTLVAMGDPTLPSPREV